MNVLEILTPLIERPVFEPGDYVGEDGLCYCGRCHTPKQTRGSGVLEGRLLPDETWLNLGIQTLTGIAVYGGLCLIWWKVSKGSVRKAFTKFCEP